MSQDSQMELREMQAETSRLRAETGLEKLSTQQQQFNRKMDEEIKYHEEKAKEAAANGDYKTAELYRKTARNLQQQKYEDETISGRAEDRDIRRQREQRMDAQFEERKKEFDRRITDTETRTKAVLERLKGAKTKEERLRAESDLRNEEGRLRDITKEIGDLERELTYTTDEGMKSKIEDRIDRLQKQHDDLDGAIGDALSSPGPDEAARPPPDAPRGKAPEAAEPFGKKKIPDELKKKLTTGLQSPDIDADAARKLLRKKLSEDGYDPSEIDALLGGGGA
jgi:hypothetical protein